MNMKSLGIRPSTEALLRGVTLPDGQIMALVDYEFRIDHSYQRPFAKQTVENVSGNKYNPDALGTFIAGRRRVTGYLYLVDGQSRFKGLQMRKDKGLSVPKKLLCLITPNTTRRQEARMFLYHNTAKEVQGNDKFRARLVDKQQPELSIDTAIKEEGFVLEYVTGRRRIENNGIVTIGQLKKYPEVLQNALQLLRMVCGGKGNKAECVPEDLRNGYVIQGLALFLLGQGSKELASIAKTIKLRTIDLPEGYKEVKRAIAEKSHFGKDRPKLFADWLTRMCGNGIIGKAA